MKYQVGDIVKINGHEFVIINLRWNIEFDENEYWLAHRDQSKSMWINEDIVNRHITDSVTQDNVKVICDKLNELARNQQPLSEEFAKVLQDNLCKLLEK